MTVPEVAALLRIGQDRVRALIKSGELGAIDTGTRARRRFVVLPHHLAEWERLRRVSRPAPKPARKRKRPARIDFFPD
jgi:excisionase family DNA binding protein